MEKILSPLSPYTKEYVPIQASKKYHHINKIFLYCFSQIFPQSCIPRLPRVVSSPLSWILCVENKNVYLRLGQVWTEKFVKFLCWVGEVKMFLIGLQF